MKINLDECVSADVVCEHNQCEAHTDNEKMYYSTASHIYCRKHIEQHYDEAK